MILLKFKIIINEKIKKILLNIYLYLRNFKNRLKILPISSFKMSKYNKN